VVGLADAKTRAAELVDLALESLQDFDEKAEPLREIARYIVARKS
jgi:geranylgeranyl diphosphate synthase type II